MPAGGRNDGVGSGIGELVARLVRTIVEETQATVLTTRRRQELVLRLVLDDPARLEVLLRADDDPSLLTEVTDVQALHRPVALILRRGSSTSTTVSTLAKRLQRLKATYPPIGRTTRAASPGRTALSAGEVEALLGPAGAQLQRRGVVLQLPVELTAKGRARLRAALHVGQARDDDGLPSWGLGAAATEPFQWQLALGDTSITFDELRALADAKRPVVRLRGRWVGVDPGELAEAAKALRELEQGTMPMAQAAGLALAGGIQVSKAIAAPVVASGRVQRAVDVARSLETAQDVPEPTGFEGRLRPYQRRGLAWLLHLESAGVGGILADDMGLGKTAQAIALLCAAVERGTDAGATLVVCPASVLPNWERELARFAPALTVIRHHGSARARRAERFRARLHPGTVVVTTYATLRSSAAVLGTQSWERVIVDEAQNIKNAGTAQAKAVRSLDARHRLALTGTPVENRLDDLWSIMQVTNPGLLGSRAAFRERFAAPAERGDLEAGERLRRLTRPFVLRRTKADPGIAPDLPPKVDADVACTLTLEQASLYEAAVAQALDDIDQAEGMRRRARILTLLTELKQICGHPALYLHEKGPLPGRSGKLDRCLEMLDELQSTGEPALVFTQYVEMGRLLVAAGRDALDTEVPFLHGGLSLAARQELVDAFQSVDGPHVLLVSLRAGGTGLNLTRAGHVIHYDRWWNPAVEDQATDRAHRIGQRGTVFVHRLLVAGTLEERIADLLATKRTLASSVVRSGEGWLTELPTDDLRRLVQLP